MPSTVSCAGPWPSDVRDSESIAVPTAGQLLPEGGGAVAEPGLGLILARGLDQGHGFLPSAMLVSQES